ncbi:unnamed protein product, partial [Mesorhabditis belari]|uniref:CBS domain-containing protein n=1 Tax=Mesorhabditis belari TaxID=2138241 RepID=A0AAF3FKV1_9BILA
MGKPRRSSNPEHCSVDASLRAMLDASAKPINIYYQQPESGYDSAIQSADSSRRNSLGFREFVKKRRFSIVGRTTISQQRPLFPGKAQLVSRGANNGESLRKGSDSQSGDSPDDGEEEISPRPLFQRRMSVPEKVFFSADYAILRPTQEPDVRFEIVAAFDRFTDPYRHYMQSLTCYDLAPIHSAVSVMDGDLLIHKGLTNLLSSGHQAAIIYNVDIKGGFSMLTFTDCLRAIVLAHQGIQPVAEQTVSQFIQNNNGKQLITANVGTSIWDAAKMICLNSVHRIPIMQQEEPGEPKIGDVLYMLTLRTVFNETILKLSDPKFSNIKQRTLSESKIGTWTNLHTVTEESLIAEAVEIFLEKRISCVPVLGKDQKVIGVLSKSDLMNELQTHPDNYLDILKMPVMQIIGPRKSPFITPTSMLLEVIAYLVSGERQSLCVVNVDGHLLGVVSYADLMDYIQNSSEIHHKMSCT